jgi:hypothetical protein
MMAEDRDNTDPKSASRLKRIKARNWAMLVLLGSLVVLFYVITVVKMGGAN